MTPNTKTAEQEAEELARRLFDGCIRKNAIVELANIISDKRRLEWCYDHMEIEAACGGEVALEVRRKVMERRAAIDAAMKERQS